MSGLEAPPVVLRSIYEVGRPTDMKSGRAPCSSIGAREPRDGRCPHQDVWLPHTCTLLTRLQRAIADGHGEHDVAAAVTESAAGRTAEQ